MSVQRHAHLHACRCLTHRFTNAFTFSETPVLAEPIDPCNPSPCGENAHCLVRDGIVRCSCIPPYVGNPYGGGCRPECIINSDCPSHLACLAKHCRNPCQGVCGQNAECSVVNHVPVCSCLSGYSGDPFTSCRQDIIKREYILMH